MFLKIENKFKLFFCNINKEGIKNAGIFNQIENSIGKKFAKTVVNDCPSFIDPTRKKSL